MMNTKSSSRSRYCANHDSCCSGEITLEVRNHLRMSSWLRHARVVARSDCPISRSLTLALVIGGSGRLGKGLLLRRDRSEHVADAAHVSGVHLQMHRQ